MKEIGWEELRQKYNFGEPGGRSAVLVCHSIPAEEPPRTRLQAPEFMSFGSYIDSTTDLAKVLEILDDTTERGKRLIILDACSLPVGTANLGRLNPLISEIIHQRPNCLIIPMVWDLLAEIIKFGSPALGSATPMDDLRKSLYSLSEEAFRLRPGLEDHLGIASIRGLKKRWFQSVVVDGFQNGRELAGGKLFAASWRLASWIKKHIPYPRIGILLPPGLGATVANLACSLADVTPVNINFTAGRQANEAALKQGEVFVILTAEAMKSKVKDFPWPEKTIDLKEVMLSFSKSSLAWRWLAGTLMPPILLARWMGVPKAGGQREAALLFTSGSVGEPKGVVLTHRNIIANVGQIDAVLSRGPIYRMLGSLPIFHSFGYTVTCWWPMLGGPAVTTYVSPTETSKLSELIEKYEIDLLITTPTFLRSFLRKALPGQLRSLKIVVTGAEKLPLDLREEFERKFNLPVCEGFGMTEASPVVAVNLIEFSKKPGTIEYESPRRLGSVGRLVPGMNVRIRHPETNQELPLGESGMIWLKGANIFPGYLGDSKRTSDVLIDGWYSTGDIGRVDEDGFLFIEGRVSRFSKIGGEMVPHGVVEARLLELYRPTLGEDFMVVVIGVPNQSKGEALVALVNHPVVASEARSKLAQAGLPNLWIPRDYLTVETIPTLATGKLDIKGCQQLACRSSILS